VYQENYFVLEATQLSNTFILKKVKFLRQLLQFHDSFNSISFMGVSAAFYSLGSFNSFNAAVIAFYSFCCEYGLRADFLGSWQL